MFLKIVYLKKTAKKRFNIDWPSSGGQQYQSSSNEVQLRPSAPQSVIIEVEIAHAR
jgi:hypothetical protein